MKAASEFISIRHLNFFNFFMVFLNESVGKFFHLFKKICVLFLNNVEEYSRKKSCFFIFIYWKY